MGVYWLRQDHEAALTTRGQMPRKKLKTKITANDNVYGARLAA